MTKGNIFSKGLLSVLLALLIPVVSWSQVSGVTYATAKSTGGGTLKVPYVETPGFVYRNAGEQLTGVCIEIMEDFVEYVKVNEGITLKLDYVGNGSSFSQMYQTAKNGSGGVVGIGNITITDERRSEVTFTPHFIENKAILITQKGIPTLSDVSNVSSTFSGMTAYTTQGSLNENRIMDLKSNHWPSMPVQFAPSSPAVLNRVLNDPKGFAYLDLVFYVDAIKNGKPIQRHAVADAGSEQFGFVLPKGSDWESIWRDFYNQGNGYRNSTEYKRILGEHLGPAAVRLIESVN